MYLLGEPSSLRGSPYHCGQSVFPMSTIEQVSHFLPYRDGQLHLREIRPVGRACFATPILMLHGAMSNGRVFYSSSGRGLACFLAEAGYCVYVLDTAGRGMSEPKLAKGFTLGQGEVIREQLPLTQTFILSRHPKSAQVNWCAHSWGGVLMASCIVRFPHIQASVRSLLTFGSKRTIKTQSLKKWFMVDLFWNRLAPQLAKTQGYLAAEQWRMGMDNESKASLIQSIDWVRGDWIDHDDSFDYTAAAKRCQWPVSWFIAGINDKVLGNPDDVRDMMAECNLGDAKFTLLSRANGYKHDYGHADMLTQMDAATDHFQEIKDWYLSFDIQGLN